MLLHVHTERNIKVKIACVVTEERIKIYRLLQTRFCIMSLRCFVNTLRRRKRKTSKRPLFFMLSKGEDVRFYDGN